MAVQDAPCCGLASLPPWLVAGVLWVQWWMCCRWSSLWRHTAARLWLKWGFFSSAGAAATLTKEPLWLPCRAACNVSLSSAHLFSWKKQQQQLQSRISSANIFSGYNILSAGHISCSRGRLALPEHSEQKTSGASNEKQILIFAGVTMEVKYSEAAGRVRHSQLNDTFTLGSLCDS